MTVNTKLYPISSSSSVLFSESLLESPFLVLSADYVHTFLSGKQACNGGEPQGAVSMTVRSAAVTVTGMVVDFPLGYVAKINTP